jgi:hypothetical protein
MKVLILGGARSVMDDALAALRLFTPNQIVAVNHVGILWPGRIDKWCTLHPDELHVWQEQRRQAGRNDDYESITFHTSPHRRASRPARIERYVDQKWPDQRNTGSSGLFAVKVAIEDGASHIVLAGMPMTLDGGHIVRPGEWDAGSYQETWREQADRLGNVRSMSGWTSLLLGRPTQDWLAEQPSPRADVRERSAPDGARGQAEA